jgi:hypothetical protein
MKLTFYECQESLATIFPIAFIKKIKNQVVNDQKEVVRRQQSFTSYKNLANRPQIVS